MIISLRQFCEQIYCGYVAARELKVGDHGDLVLTLTVIERGNRMTHHVEFSDACDFKNGRTSPEQIDDVIELSLVELERKSNGWRVRFQPYNHYDVSFRCAEIRFDGQLVDGEGQWTQDSMPASHPA